jgi:ketosteroid isomerase-like protein
MSQENVDAAQMGLDAFNRRDKEVWLALNDPEVEVVPPRDWPESDPLRGREAVWDVYVENIEAFREGALEHVELIDAGNDKVVAHMRGEMHGKACVLASVGRPVGR